MNGRHLGERIHDLLDNRLSVSAASEAMAHLDECADCGQRWRELVAAREALTSSQAGIDMSFARQLLDRDRMREMAQREDRSRARAARGRDRRPLALTLSIAVILVTVAGAAYVAGAPQDVSTEVTASGEDGAVNVARFDSAALQQAEPAGTWILPDWQLAGVIPVEAHERVADDGTRYLVASILVDGMVVEVAEVEGRLEDDAVASLPQASIDGRSVYIVSESPLRFAWQSGSMAVFVACHCAPATLERAVTAFPVAPSGGAMTQILSGLGVFSDALTGH